ncbi:hypothetical protein BY458DRAFT_545302 [Sporodiniella umbellata]|nr:hypothetical protein BY458DRAFT_545302 [Sporodiniella umbellata]
MPVFRYRAYRKKDITEESKKTAPNVRKNYPRIQFIYDSVSENNKRIRANIPLFDESEDSDWYNTTYNIFNPSGSAGSAGHNNTWDNKHNITKKFELPATSCPNNDYMLPSTPLTVPIDIPSPINGSDFEVGSLDNTTSPSSFQWQDDYFSCLTPRPSISTSNAAPISSPPSEKFDSFNGLTSVSPLVADALSKIQFSYTEKGFNLAAKISNATELRSLIDAFSHLCCEDTGETNSINNQQPQIDKMVLFRNKSSQTKPVNYFAPTSDLGQPPKLHMHSGSIQSLQEITDACIHCFFNCSARFKPIMKKEEFLNWYKHQERPTDTLIVNALCSYVFRHMISHHLPDGLGHFFKNQDKIREQEEHFYSRARECLSQSFDTPDRYTIIGLLFMSIRGESSKRHHYIGMAVSALHELQIYPRMASEDVDCYDKEIDTRLWWFVWAIDFYLWSAGAPKNTPQPRFPGEIDLPQIFEQDIDDTEISVIGFVHCLTLWRIQADIVAALYNTENSELTVEQLAMYDKRLFDFHNGLPKYLHLGSGFEYGCGELFAACLRVNIEYNATLIILHKLFIPEMHDSRPSQFSLESLNICLSTALAQLSTIKTCNMVELGRCAFDRDELSRAAEIISFAMDIYHTCASPEDQAKIVQGIEMEDFNQGLIKALDTLTNTVEYHSGSKGCQQIADWMRVEIRRHQSTTTYRHKAKDDTTAVKRPDFFLAHLKPQATSSIQEQHSPVTPKQPKQTKTSKQPKNAISFQNQFSVNSVSPSNLSPRKASFSSAPLLVQFNNYVPSEPKRTKQEQQSQFTSSAKSQTRFRYFNPRKMNKFLFIDEHPSI